MCSQNHLSYWQYNFPPPFKIYGETNWCMIVRFQNPTKCNKEAQVVVYCIVVLVVVVYCILKHFLNT